MTSWAPGCQDASTCLTPGPGGVGGRLWCVRVRDGGGAECVLGWVGLFRESSLLSLGTCRPWRGSLPRISRTLPRSKHHKIQKAKRMSNTGIP